MDRKLTLVALIASLFTLCEAQTFFIPKSELYANVPKMLSMIPKSEMPYVAAHQKLTVDSVADGYFKVRPTEVDEIVGRHYKDFIVMIHTVYTPQPDSKLIFLDTLGNVSPKLAASVVSGSKYSLDRVGAKDFYLPNDTLSETEYLKYALPFVPYWQFRGDTLSLSWDVQPYLTREDWPKIAKAHRATPILYIWDESKFTSK